MPPTILHSGLFFAQSGSLPFPAIPSAVSQTSDLPKMSFLGLLFLSVNHYSNRLILLLVIWQSPRLDLLPDSFLTIVLSWKKLIWKFLQYIQSVLRFFGSAMVQIKLDPPASSPREYLLELLDTSALDLYE